MNPKTSVCFVSPHLYPILAPEKGIAFVGGAEVQQSIIAQGLIELGYDVSAVTLDYGQADGCRVKGIKIYKAFRPDAGIKGLRFFYPRFTSIWGALNRAKADIYYQRAAGMLTGVLAKFCNTKRKKFIFAGAHDNDFILGDHGLLYWRDKITYEWGLRQADRVIVQNSMQKKCLYENYGIDGSLIHNVGYDSSYRANFNLTSVAWIGVMRSWKGPLRFVELAAGNPKINFLMVGGPSSQPNQQVLWNSVREKAANLGNLTLAGHVPYKDMENIFKSFSVLVNTSDKEGFPNTFLEAWARGIPTVSFINVAADNRPTPGIVVKDQNELATTLNRLMTNEETWKKESLRCRHAFEQYFGFGAVADDYCAVFNNQGMGDRENQFSRQET